MDVEDIEVFSDRVVGIGKKFRLEAVGARGGPEAACHHNGFWVSLMNGLGGQCEYLGVQWKIKEFSLFGSVIREDFMPDSDVDVLVSFTPESSWSLWDMVTMQEELEQIFKRKVDLVEKEGLRNPFRRHEILKNKETIYVL